MSKFRATSEGDVPLTPEEEAEWDAIQAELAIQKIQMQKKQYQLRRAEEYPPMADYLDGVVKGDQAQIDAYIAACLAVKAKYPKPE